MLFVFPISPHLEEKSLEGISIIVCVRWMIFVPLCVFLNVTIYLGLKNHSPDAAYHFNGRYLIPFLAVSYLILVARDVWLVRRKAIGWDDHRIHSQTVMKRLPLLLVVFVPLFLLIDGPGQSAETMKWGVDMLWVFNVLAVFFYTVYFALLLAIPKLPKRPSIIGFALAIAASFWGWHRMKEEDTQTAAMSLRTQHAHLEIHP